jgi:hypothetical protein
LDQEVIGVARQFADDEVSENAEAAGLLQA